MWIRHAQLSLSLPDGLQTSFLSTPFFLSHSGHDKPFVERLCEKLEAFNYTPFFDQNFDSLPKGERFPPHIFKAAEQCSLAVIVLSEGYLTSKWPMLELAAFVKAKATRNPNMKLLPLFYKLSPSDLVPEKWMESWKKLAEDGNVQTEEIKSWSEAVQVLVQAKNVETGGIRFSTEHDDEDGIMPEVFPKQLTEVVNDLRPFNGLEFRKSGTSEGTYIKDVVDVIFRIIPPVMKYKIDWIRGYQRMCEKASSLFVEGTATNNLCKPGHLYVGLYGMGGVGKTTLCEAMCSFYQAKFRGRVCHVELQGDTHRERIERLKHVIRELGGCHGRVLERVTSDSQGWRCLQERLERQPAAFLAVDNVGDSDSSRCEAERFIGCGLACGSKRLPSPLQPCEDLIVKACIRECKFSDDGYDTQQYHPLVLRALGTFFQDIDIMEWKEALKVEKKLQESRESKRVNDILGLNYSNLSAGQKLLFLDVAFLFSYRKIFFSFSNKQSISVEDEYQWAISLLAALHGISTFAVKRKVKELQRKSLIYESSSSLRTHDLYIEFAQSLVSMEDSKERAWWVGHEDANGYNTTLKRLVLEYEESVVIDRPHLWECPNLECLVMFACIGTLNSKLNSKLDLKRFPNLRVLLIDDDMETAVLCVGDDAVDFDDNLYGPKNQIKGCLPELRMVSLDGYDFRRIPFLRECWNLTYVSIRFPLISFDMPQDVTSFLANLKELETLSMCGPQWTGFPVSVYQSILQCAASMKSLKCLIIGPGDYEEDESVLKKLDLSALGSLTTLSLASLSSSVKELVGLDQLLHLRTLNLERCTGLTELAYLDLPRNLRKICVAFGPGLKFQGDELNCFQELHTWLKVSHQCLGCGTNSSEGYRV